MSSQLKKLQKSQKRLAKLVKVLTLLNLKPKQLKRLTKVSDAIQELINQIVDETQLPPGSSPASDYTPNEPNERDSTYTPQQNESGYNLADDNIDDTEKYGGSSNGGQSPGSDGFSIM